MSSSPVTINWNQIKTLTYSSIKSRYRNTIAGLVWVVMSPILMFTAQAYAFKFVLKINFDNYPLFLLTGLLPWIFFVQSAMMGTTLFTSQSRLYKSFPIHPLASLISILFDNLINLGLAFILILGFVLLVSGHAQPANFFLFPLPLFAIFLATVGTTFILATLQVFYHDTKFISDFALNLAFYVTPIFYPPEFVDPRYRWVVQYNPFALLVRPMQALSRDKLPDDYWLMLVSSYGVAFIVLALGLITWNRLKNSFYFRL